MAKIKSHESGVLLSVTLDEGEYSELSRLAASLDLSAAWMIRHAVSEFIAHYRASPENSLSLKTSEGPLTDGRKQCAG